MEQGEAGVQGGEEPGVASASAAMDGLSLSDSAQRKPTVIIVIGMAGSGKTTFIQRLNAHLHEKQLPGYLINLDPAVMQLPYGPNIDIRDTVNYKNVMKQYNLGPNGAILTSLNLFATRFDQVVGLAGRERDPPLRYCVVDTPGQIEIFSWSASGAIITEALASEFPTVVAYVVDTPRCTAPQSFMTNMLQACSIFYKSRVPLLLVFNKADVCPHAFAQEWMADFENFHAALESETNYAATLSRSLSVVLEKFYQELPAVGVSALTGQGMDDFLAAVGAARQDYERHYLPGLQARKAGREAAEAARREADRARLAEDVAAGRAARGGAGRRVVLDARPGAALAAVDEGDAGGG